MLLSYPVAMLIFWLLFLPGLATVLGVWLEI